MSTSTAFQSQQVQKLRELHDWLIDQTLSTTKTSWNRHMDFVFDYTRKFLEAYLKDPSLTIYEYSGVDPWMMKLYDKSNGIKKDQFLPEKIREEVFEYYSTLIDKMTNAQEKADNHMMEYLKDIKLKDYDIPSLSGYYWVYLIKLYEKQKTRADNHEKWVEKMLNSIHDYIKSIDDE